MRYRSGDTRKRIGYLVALVAAAATGAGLAIVLRMVAGTIT